MNPEGRLDFRFRRALAAFPARLRPGLIHILELPDKERASAIGELFREGLMPNTAELLMDVEQEPGLRLVVLEELRRLQASGRPKPT